MNILNKNVENCKYLSEFISETPSHCLINKGITGCGGTTLELEAPRDSIILCPTKNLVTSKSALGYFGVTGDVTKSEIESYIHSSIKYKKIVATYDALKRLIEIIPNCKEYFLLIDEYHLLFNDYSLRSDAILYILNNFRSFDNWAFLTATPLKDEFILDELKDVDQVNYIWDNAVPVSLNIRDTYYVQKELLNLISIYKDRNLHIFLNSVSTIYKIIEKLDTDDFRVVCSENSKTKVKNFSKITDPVRHINFYTSCAFEGCDIYDEDGYCIIVSDTNIATTVLDITTKVRQVCGRLRDSKYKDTVTIILNTNKHRYAGTTKTEFLNIVKDSEDLGKVKENQFRNATYREKEAELRLYNKETYSSLYLNRYNGEIFYDINLKKLDLYNYDLISEIYSSSISVLTEASKTGFKTITPIKNNKKGLDWICDKLKEIDKKEYTYKELEEIFKPTFQEKGIKWNQNTSIKNYFPNFKKSKKQIEGVRNTYYTFNIL